MSLEQFRQAVSTLPQTLDPREKANVISKLCPRMIAIEDETERRMAALALAEALGLDARLVWWEMARVQRYQ